MEEIILTDYQKDAQITIDTMNKCYKGGILLFEPGMGKTITMVAYLRSQREKMRKENKEIKPDVIVCSINLLETWQREIARFYKSKGDKLPKILVHSGIHRDKDVYTIIDMFDYVITTPYYIKNMEIFNPSLRFEKTILFNTVVLDEIHEYRNLIKSMRKKHTEVYSLYEFCKDKCLYRWGLTGTLYNNKNEEIISISSLVIPRLYSSYLTYDRKEFPYDEFINNNCIKKTKKDMKMVDISYHTIKSELNPFEKEVISDTIKETKEYYDTWGTSLDTDVKRKAQGKILSLITKLRMSINSVFTIEDDSSLDEIPIKSKYKYSSKSQTIYSLVNKACYEGLDPTNGIVIFTQYVTFIDLLYDVLKYKFQDKDDFTVWKYTGKTPVNTRENIIREFRTSNKPRVLLITFSTGGVGINLDPCSTIIIAEQWYNPAVEKQAEDRVHRLTQKNDVNVYRVITDSYVDEWIKKLKQVKIYNAHVLGLTDNNMIQSNGIVNEDFKLKDLKILFDMALGNPIEKKKNKKNKVEPDYDDLDDVSEVSDSDFDVDD